jgi:opacity protein-like surface antigen
MKRRLLAALGLAVCAAPVGAADFEAPVRLKAGDTTIRVEAPGYACPTWADVDGDGKKDLIVGQFAKGKMQVFKGQGGTTFAAGEWLKAEGKVAEVPGVW